MDHKDVEVQLTILSRTFDAGESHTDDLKGKSNDLEGSFSRFQDTSNKLQRHMNRRNNIITGFAFFACLLTFCIFAALPVTEIVMGTIYKDDVVCETDVVDIPVWLIVKGATGLFVVVFLVMAILASVTRNDCFVGLIATFTIPFFLSCIFSLAWLIIGSVVFWRDCIHLTPTSVNTLMWCSLIIGYVSIYLQWVTSNKKKDD